MGEGDERVWAWFHENCLLFAARFGGIWPLFEALNLAGAQRYLFLRKLGEIMVTAEREELAKAERETNRGKH